MTIAGVVAAMAFEARCLGAMSRRPDGLLTLTATAEGATLVKISGMGFDRAIRAARELVDAGAVSLLSWGTAGALDPSLTAGTVVLATEVISHDPAISGLEAHFPTSASWRKQAIESLAAHGLVVEAPLVTQAAPLTTVEAKARLFRNSGAAAVDMESAAVAKVAAAYGLPFLAIRVVVDTAGDSLPPALVRAIRAELCGEQRPYRLALPLLQAPSQWSEIARLAWRYRSASRSLRLCAGVAHRAAPVNHPEANA